MPTHLILILVLTPAVALAASIPACPVQSPHCQCGPERPFYSVKCAGIEPETAFQDLIGNLTCGALILEVDSVRWGSIPLMTLKDSSLQTLIIANSTLARLHDVDSEEGAVGGLRHLSLENVTFLEPPRWKEFSRIRDLRVLFLYNTSIQNELDDSFGRHVSKSLRSLTIADSGLQRVGKRAFMGLEDLVYLRISHGNLSGFSDDAFSSPSNLEQLRLDYNKIESLPAGMFQNFPKLKLLSLSNNTLSSLPEEVFGPLWRPDLYLEMRGNPIKCDCKMRWMTTATTKPRNIIGECALPKPLFGKNIKDLTEEDLNC